MNISFSLSFQNRIKTCNSLTVSNFFFLIFYLKELFQAENSTFLKSLENSILEGTKDGGYITDWIYNIYLLFMTGRDYSNMGLNI